MQVHIFKDKLINLCIELSKIIEIFIAGITDVFKQKEKYIN